jgi:hypothetical protein
VSSYQVKRSEGCFVWAAPPLQTGAIIKNRKGTVERQLGMNQIRQVEEVQNVTREGIIYYYLFYIFRIFGGV